VSLFLVLFDGVFVAVGSFAVAFAMSGTVAFRVGVVAVLFVELLGFCPLVALAGGRNKEQPGGSGGEKRGQFHPGAGVADRPPMASGESFSVPRECDWRAGTSGVDIPSTLCRRNVDTP